MGLRGSALASKNFTHPSSTKRGFFPFPTLPSFPPTPSRHAYGPFYTADTKAGGWAAGTHPDAGQGAAVPTASIGTGAQRDPQHPARPHSGHRIQIGARRTLGCSDGQRRSASPSSGCGTRPLPTTPPSFTPSVPIAHRPPPLPSLQPRCQAVVKGGELFGRVWACRFASPILSARRLGLFFLAAARRVGMGSEQKIEPSPHEL